MERPATLQTTHAEGLEQNPDKNPGQEQIRELAQPVQCTRCKKHSDLSEWVDARSRKFSGMWERTCPHCSCRNFYDLTPHLAWVWSSGLVHSGERAPSAAECARSLHGTCRVFARGPRADLEAIVRTLAPRGQDEHAFSHVIPGMMHAESSEAADAAFSDWMQQCLKDRRYRSAVKHGVLFSEQEQEVLAMGALGHA